jgi:hypothetical protein
LTSIALQRLAWLPFLLAACSSTSDVPSDAGPTDATIPGDSQAVDANPSDAGSTDTSAVDSTADVSADAGCDAATQSDPNNCGNCGTTCRGPCNAGQCSPFTSVRPGDLWEGETHIAVGTNGYVAAVWIASSDPTWDDPGSGATSYIGATFSTDFGATWTPVQALRAPPPDDPYAFDPAVAVDAANNFYVVFGGVANQGIQGFSRVEVWVATAPKGTTTFGAPSLVNDPADTESADGGPVPYWNDKFWIAVTKDQEIVVTYTRLEFASCPFGAFWPACISNIVVARSTDAKSWTRAQATSNSAGSGPDGGAPDFTSFAFLCASTTTDRLWLVHNDEPGGGAGGKGVVLRFSDDDGATWSPANMTVVAPPTATGIEVEHSCAGNGNDVWVAYELDATGKGLATSIEVAHSTNGGQTFGAPVDALDLSTSKLAWHSTVVLEANGHLDVEYYGGAFPSDWTAGVYYVHSTDLGATWSTATVLRQPITLLDSRIGTWADNWLGDYLGVTTAGGYIYTTFTDNSSGVAHVDFAEAKLP